MDLTGGQVNYVPKGGMVTRVPTRPVAVNVVVGELVVAIGKHTGTSATAFPAFPCNPSVSAPTPHDSRRPSQSPGTQVGRGM